MYNDATIVTTVINKKTEERMIHILFSFELIGIGDVGDGVVDVVVDIVVDVVVDVVVSVVVVILSQSSSSF